MGMKVLWLANARLDLQFDIQKFILERQERFAKEFKEFLKRLNAATRYAYENVALRKFQKLDQSSLRIFDYSNPAFAKIYDLMTQNLLY